MTKTTNTTTPAFVIGDRVTVCNAATLDEALPGSLVTIKSGWYVVELDEAIENSKGEETNTISARVSSLELLAPEDDEQTKQDGDEESGGTDADELDEALEEAETAASKMAEALRKARVHYQKTRRPMGAASADCADLIAKELRDYEPLEVAGICDRCFDLPKGTHAEKYAHLNKGQIRMNSGNKIRAAWKKGDDAIRARIAFVLGLDQDEHDDQPDGTDVAKMAANAE